ncbi:serpentine type 7TM GPCR chemoreceptor srt domain-containing protein [Ditylenchus destructor]|nr:serpentine type 7TM GPCR chemoreceptor srt domain-containing protein [Ditylenchus destructor]
MDTFFIHTEVYAKRYNCSALSREKWYAFGEPRPYVGTASICVGVLLLSVYVPFIITMMQRQFLSMSCYKLMLFLGIMDVVTIIGGSLITGYLLIVGGVFCTHEALIYFTGLTGLSSYSAGCITCMILTLNRCIDIYFPDIGKALFGGWRTWIWLIVPICVITRIMLYETTFCFNSSYIAWFTDPFYGMPYYVHATGPDRLPYTYQNTLHVINNIVTIIVLCSGNAILCYYVFRSQGRMSSTYRMKRQFIIQVCVISGLITLAASIYAYMQFFYTPSWLILMGSMSFNLSSGALAFTYLFLNPSLRSACFRLFCAKALGSKVDRTSSLFKAKDQNALY